MSYNGVAYSLAPGDYLIIHHNVAYMPDRVNTISSTMYRAQSSAPLTSASNNGDWYYDNSTSIFSYIGKNWFGSYSLQFSYFSASSSQESIVQYQPSRRPHLFESY